MRYNLNRFLSVLMTLVMLLNPISAFAEWVNDTEAIDDSVQSTILDALDEDFEEEDPFEPEESEEIWIEQGIPDEEAENTETSDFLQSENEEDIAPPLEATISEPEKSPENDDMLIEDNILVRYKGEKEIVVVPEGVVAIAKEAFIGNEKLRRVELPESLEAIGEAAFFGCTALEEVVLQGEAPKLEQIDSEAFSYCPKLKDRTFAETADQVAQDAFDSEAEESELETREVRKSRAGISISSNPKSVTVAPNSKVTFTFEVSGTGLTYQWQTKLNSTSDWANTGLTGARTNTLVIESAPASFNGRQYRCMVTDSSGAGVISSPATLSVVDFEIVSQTGDQTVFAGDSVAISVNATGAGLTYQWQTKLDSTSNWANTGLNGAKTATLSFSAPIGFNNRQYRCVVTDNTGSTLTSKLVTLTVTDIKIDNQPSDQTVRAGEKARFSVIASGSNITYQWQTKLDSASAWANTGLNGAKTATLNFDTNANFNGRKYRCILTGANGASVYSSEVTLTISTINITAQPKDTKVTAGAQATFGVTASGTNLSYQWQTKLTNTSAWANTGLNGAKTATLSFDTNANFDGREYRCKITDVNGAVEYTNAAKLTVVAEFFSEQPKNARIASNSTATFTVVANGSGLTYQWQTKTTSTASWANTSLNGAKTATLSFTANESYNNRQYRCLVTDASGVLHVSDVVKLTVVSSIITLQPLDIKASVGAPVRFMLEAEGGDSVSYQWQTKLTATSNWANTTLNGAKKDTLNFEATANLSGRQYRCLVTDANGTVFTSNTVTLTIVPGIVTKHPENLTISAGQHASFTAAASGSGLKYQWETLLTTDPIWYKTTLNGATTANLNFDAPIGFNGRQYRCVFTDANGAVHATNPATLTVVNNIITAQPANVKVGAGTTAKFTVGASGSGLTYQWQTKLTSTSDWANTGLNGAKTATLSFDATANLTGRQYRCIVKDSSGNSYTSNAATLTVADSIITSQPANVTANPGDSVIFAVAAKGTGLTYQWQTKLTPTSSWANTGLNGAKTAGLTFDALASFDARQYRCLVTDANGVVYTSNAVTLTVRSSGITTDPASLTVKPDTTVKFTVGAFGKNLTYQWQTKTSSTASWANTGLTGAKTDTLNFTALASFDGRQYRCLVTDGDGATYISAAATLTVVSNFITAQPADLTVKADTAVKFTVATKGSNLTYQWQTKLTPTSNWANTGLNGAKTATLSFSATANLTGRQYRCVVTDANGVSYTSDAATLTVVSSGITTDPASITVKLDTTVKFTVGAFGKNLTYQWQTKTSSTASWANTGLTGAKTDTLNFTALASFDGRQYRCLVTDGDGATYISAAATLTVVSNFITAQPTDLKVKADTAVKFTVATKGSNLTYQWQTKLTPTSSWANTGLNGAKTATLSFTATANLTGRQYRCIVTDANGVSYTSDAATLTVVTTIITQQPANVKVGAGTTAKFTVGASGSGLTYQWQTKLTSTSDWANTGLNGAKTATLSFDATTNLTGRQYRCIVTDANGISFTSDAAVLTVVNSIISTQPKDLKINAGGQAKFTVAASGSGLSYQWQTKLTSTSDWANTGLNGAKTATLSFDATANLTGRQYRCIVTDASGLVYTSNAATLSVVTTIITAQPSNLTTSAGAQAKFTVSANGATSYQWQTKTSSTASWANTGLTGAKTAALTFEALANFNGRKYRCIVTDASVFTYTSDELTLNLVAGPTIGEYTSDVETYAGNPVEFTVTATGTGLTYQWQTKTSSTASWTNTGLTGAKTNTLSFTPTAAFDQRQYRCVVTDKYGVSVTSVPATLSIWKEVEAIVISDDIIWLDYGNAWEHLTAEVYPADAKDQSIHWEVGDPSIAYVDEDGYVSPVKGGATRVYAVLDSDPWIEASCLVMVAADGPDWFEVNPGSFTLDVEWAMVENCDGYDVEYSEVGVSYGEYIRIDDPSQTSLTIENLKPNTTYEFTVCSNLFYEEGENSYAAYGYLRDEVDDVIYLQVTTDSGIDHIDINQNWLELYNIGDTYQLVATVYPEDGINNGVYWESPDYDVAVVDQNGLVTATGIGGAYVYATSVDDDNVWEPCIIVVLPPAPNEYNAFGADESIYVEWSPVDGCSGYDIEYIAVENGMFEYIHIDDPEQTSATITGLEADTCYAVRVCSTLEYEDREFYSYRYNDDEEVENVYVWTSLNEWKKPYASVTSAGSGNANNGTLITEDMLEHVLQINDVTGGWFRMVAPYDGDYYFTVLADTITDSMFSLIPSINGVRIDALNYWQSSDIQSRVIQNVHAGDVITWWDCDNSGKNYTFKQPFKLAISISGSTTVSPTSVSLDTTSATLYVGDTVQLVGTVKPVNASDKSLTWSSSNTSVATVYNGSVTAKSQGTATITATTSNGKTATCTVTVNNVLATSLTLNTTAVTVKVGETATITSSLLPSNATVKSLNYAWSNSAVFKVNSGTVNGNKGTFVIEGVAPGTATLTIRTTDGTNKSVVCTITVVDDTPVGTPVITDISRTAYGTVRIEWSAAANAEGYKVYRRAASNGYIATLGANQLYYEDTSPSDGRVNRYYITAYKGSKQENSEVVGIGIDDIIPTPVISVNNGGSGTLKIAWAQVKDEDGDAVSGYKVYRSTSKNGTYTLIATTTSNSYTDKNLTNGSTYYYSVSAYTGTNIQSIRSAAVAGTPSAADNNSRPADDPATIAVTGISLNASSISLVAGNSQTLTATIAPSNASDKRVVWTSSNTSVATVSSGTVTAKSAGTATITATASDGSGKKATCTVTVTSASVSVTGVSLNKSSVSLTVGGTLTLTATVSPSNASVKSVNWSSSNTSVATVSASGLITAKSAGTATITATAADGSGKKATCTVTVAKATVSVTGVSLDRTSVSLNVGDTQTVKATVSPSNASVNDVNWSSSNASVATVNGSGKITAIAAGTATITATAADGSGKKATCTVTVVKPSKLAAPTSFYVDGVTHSAVSVKFSAVSGASGYYVYYSDGTTFSSTLKKVEADKSTKVGYIDGLTSGKTYYFWVAAYDSNGTIGNESSRVSAITGKVSLTARSGSSSGAIIADEETIDWPIDETFKLYCSQSNGNGKYLVKSYVMSGKPAFKESDINHLVTGVAYQGTGYYYGSNGNDEFSQSTMNGLPFSVSDCSVGQYVKIWVAAEDANYSNNDCKDAISFTLKLVSSTVNDSNARQKAVEYAEKALNYTWYTSEPILMHYNYGLDSSKNKNGQIVPVFGTDKPVIAMGNVRGIPYSLSQNGGGGEEDSPEYYMEHREISERSITSKVYKDDGNGGYLKIGPKYGMSCATFVSMCIRTGFGGSTFKRSAGTGGIYSNNSQYVTQGKAGNRDDYSRLQPGDYLYKSGHVMLVTANNGNSLTVIHQTPPINNMSPECTNKKAVKVTLKLSDGSSTVIDALQVCMNCNACKQVTMGTRKDVFSYTHSYLQQYQPMYVKYPGD